MASNPLSLIQTLPTVTLIAVDRPDTQPTWAEAHRKQLAAEKPLSWVCLRLIADGNSIKLEQAHEILQLCSSAPPVGQGQWVWIQAVETLTPEAANALLKLIEEPWPRIWFVLTTARADAVLPTIRSRAVLVRTPHALRPSLADEDFPNLKMLSDRDKLALAEQWAEDEGVGRQWLERWLQQARQTLYQSGLSPQQRQVLNAKMDQILATLALWARPIQKRLALEALLLDAVLE